ncbi:MAG: Hsp20/alpha crystallin family protein [Desulfobacterales bacterium]|nr:MAG: Hsp20/alpha crystallin family protein [Desulfobacterales bacterium]
MQLVKWNPRKDFFNLHNYVNRMFDDCFYPTARQPFHSSLTEWNPIVDIYEKEYQFVIKADLPGIERKDIQIDVKDHVLTIRGERSSENEVKKQNFYRQERALGRLERSFALPSKVDVETIKASYKDGVLKVEVPKPEEQKPKQITVH